jgi:hypothetical protein
MPNKDGTGPRGQGAMTGGGRGYCAMPANNVEKQPAHGMFNDRGRGRGMRHCFNATGMPGWMRAQKGMRAFGGYGRAISTEERSA